MKPDQSLLPGRYKANFWTQTEPIPFPNEKIGNAKEHKNQDSAEL